MKGPTTVWVFGGVLVACALIIGGLTFSRLERVERTVKVGAGLEARVNPLLATERLLRRLGYVATSTGRMTELPRTDHALILAVEDRVSTRRRAEQLLGWLEGGGTLIVGPHLVGGMLTSASTRDPLFEALGVAVIEVDAEGADERQSYETQLAGAAPCDVRFPTGHGVAFTDPEESEAGDDVFNVVWGDRGDGRYYVMTDLRFLRNDEIGDLDHARFIHDVLEMGRPLGGVLLVHGEQGASLLGLVLRHGWLPLIAAAACMGAALWRGGARFGPLQPIPRPGSRSLLEHVEAAGRFLWRRQRHDALLEGARRVLRKTLAARRPGIARMDGEDQVRELAALSRLAEGLVRNAWTRLPASS